MVPALGLPLGMREPHARLSVRAEGSVAMLALCKACGFKVWPSNTQDARGESCARCDKPAIYVVPDMVRFRPDLSLRRYTDDFGQEWLAGDGVPIDAMTKRIMAQEAIEHLRAMPSKQHTFATTGDTFLHVTRHRAVGLNGVETYEVRELRPVRVAIDYKAR